ncbi:MAG: DNA-binding protein [Rhizobiaceae bacterium]|nr:DNA-binding protein [Rhizobiaceae bacterium]|tara:strand:- start:563 stop:808 length:246 start_codon:yes stop_codon:yes gene_type:complete
MVRDHYQTVKEVADRLRVGEATVRGWIKVGELRAIEIGKGWRISDSDLEAFLSSHATRAREISAQETESVFYGEAERENGT